MNRCGKAAHIKGQIGIEFWIAPDLLQFLRIAFGAADFCGKVFGWTLRKDKGSGDKLNNVDQNTRPNTYQT